jgi:hypothetical protein
MKRNLFLGLTALALALVINVPFAAAQSAKANVPFDFAIAGKTMPAGTYTVSEISDSQIRVANTESTATLLMRAQREERLDYQSAKMVFHKYGDKYFLAEVWNGAGATGLHIPASKWEEEIKSEYRAAGPHMEEVVVALR